MRRRQAAPGARRELIGVVAGVLVLIATAVGNEVWGGEVLPVTAVALAPAVTAILAGPLATVLIGMAASVTAFVLAAKLPNIDTGEALVRLLLVAGVSAVAALLTWQRSRRDSELRRERRLLAAEHAIADTLQRSLLPQLPPRVGRFELEGRYRPGTLGTTVGGDWYDAFVLPNDHVLLAVGDVEGRGVRAAATMGQLRSALRALTSPVVSRVNEPDAVLQALNENLDPIESPMVTMALAVIDRHGAITYAYAGHPPMFLRHADGRCEELTGGRSVPLGVFPHATFTSCRAVLGPGATLALFTDGLVERRGASIDEGLSTVRDALSEPSPSVAGLADRLMALTDDNGQADDVAVLLARLPVTTDRLTFDPLTHLGEVRGMRSTLAGWIRDHGGDDDDVLALTLSAAEAVINSLQHAYPLSGGRVGVEAVAELSHLQVTVTDDGRWRPPEATRDGKRGLTLMRGLTEMSLDTGEHGTTVCMIRPRRESVQ